MAEMVKKKRRQECGFLLLEVLLVAGILAAGSSVLLLYRQGAVYEREACLQEAALYLAKEEMAVLEHRFAAGKLVPGSYPWLGRGDAGREHVSFAVRAEVLPLSGPEGCKVVVAVHWPGRQGEKSLQLEREVYNHENAGAAKYFAGRNPLYAAEEKLP